MTAVGNGSDLRTNVIKIEDARELRELGLPILPVVDATYANAEAIQPDDKVARQARLHSG